MTSPIEREVRAYLRDAYGVTKATLSQGGGGHPRLTFEHTGRSYKLTLPSANSDRGLAFDMKRQDIRRLLGPPTVTIEPKFKRRLDDMMPEPITLSARPIHADMIQEREPDRTYHGTIAVYASDPKKRYQRRLTIGVRDDLYQEFNHTGALLVTRIDDDTFQIAPHPDNGRKTPSFHHEGSMWKFAIQTLLPNDTEPYGASPAEMILVDGSIVARVLERKGMNKNIKGAPHRAAAVTTAKPAVVGLETEMRAALTAIRRVEAETPYRLIRVKDDEGGHWAFSAPRIE